VEGKEETAVKNVKDNVPREADLGKQERTAA
jgi:hypothetical protein